ncbi:IS4 family transposase, partial [bacterium]|nr:IS4 family transposase [bacterium]
RGSIPSYIKITKGSVHDVNILDDLVLEPGSFYVMDRGYVDFKRLYRIADNLCYFVTRAKKNMVFHRLNSAEMDRSTGLRSDQTIMIDGTNTKEKYPDKLRRVRFYDKETKKYFVFITNNFEIPALIVAELYKNRWKIELFFKWIKQHLKIKKFFGTSFNAVKTQIWIAISVFVLVAIIKRKYRLEMSLYSILQVLSVSLFEKIYLYELLTGQGKENRLEMEEPDQISFFDFIEGNDL